MYATVQYRTLPLLFNDVAEQRGHVYLLTLHYFQDDTFAACLKDDKSTKHGLAQLLKNIETMSSQSNSLGSQKPPPQQKIAI